MSETTTYTPPEATEPTPSSGETVQFEVLDHEKAMGAYESQEAFLESYLERTAQLIGLVQEFETVDGESKPADVVVFLDKSARPVYWMMNEMWPLIAVPDENGEIPPKPDTKFANIDRLPWRVDKDVEITNHPSNMRTATTEDIEGLRAVYDVPGQETMDGKRILIVDEVGDSGDTQYVARKLFQEAYPDANIRAMAWMDVSTRGPKGEKIVKDVPVWYSATSELGRGVFGQVDADHPQANSSERLTDESHQFMSTRVHVARDMSPAEKERHDELVARVDSVEDADERAKMLEEIERLAFTSIDSRAMQLRAEIGEMVSQFANLELTPAVYTQNIVPEADYDARLIAKREAREAEIKKTPIWR